MKRYTIKNYRGNLVESLMKFAESHKGMRIVEAVEDENKLRLKIEESEKIEEADLKKDSIDFKGQPTLFELRNAINLIIEKYRDKGNAKVKIDVYDDVHSISKIDFHDNIIKIKGGL